MRAFKSHLWITTSIAAALALPATVVAQTAQPQAAASSVEEIIVTAQKRAEDVQSVPLSVTPITGAAIDKLHVTDLKDLTGSVPNLQILESGGVAMVAQVTIRGIGEANNPMPYVGTETTTVIDGVVQATNLFGLATQYDIDRIEVLAGPQGTLFGANTTAGVINIVTRQPTGQFGGYGEVSYGNYNAVQVQAGVNFPIIDGILAGKISFDHDSRDGFYTNLYNGQPIDNVNSNTLRGYLKWTPTSNFDATLKIQWQHMEMGNTLLNTSLSYPGETFYRPGTPFGFEIYDLIQTPDLDIDKSFTLTMNWQSPIGQLTSITNYQDYKYTESLDFSGIDCLCFLGFPGPDGWSDRGWQASQELRDVIHPVSNLEVLVGVYALTWGDAADGLDAPVFAAGPDILTEGITHERTTDLAGFTQVYWDVTKRLRLQGGLRVAFDKVYLSRANYTWDQPAGVNPLLSYNNLIGATNLGSAPGNQPSSGEHSWTNFGWKFGADYKVTDEVMLYGYYARGFKSGGFNGSVTQAVNIGPYDPEYVDTFEVGMKSEWLDHRLQANLAMFLNKWNNMQVEQFTFGGGMLNSVIVNAGKATTSGVEAQFQAVPFEGLRISGNVGYLYAKYDEFLSSENGLCPPPPAVQPAGCAVSYAGRDIPYAPHWTGSIDASYTHELFTGSLVTTLQYTYTDPKWGNYTEAPTERLPAVRLLNANVSWGPQSGHWTIGLWGRNLTNQLYAASALDVPPLFTEAVLGNPREFGAEFKFNF